MKTSGGPFWFPPTGGNWQETEKFAKLAIPYSLLPIPSPHAVGEEVGVGDGDAGRALLLW